MKKLFAPLLFNRMTGIALVLAFSFGVAHVLVQVLGWQMPGADKSSSIVGYAVGIGMIAVALLSVPLAMLNAAKSASLRLQKQS